MIFLKNDFPYTVAVTNYLLNTDFNESASWVSAENLWILGRYMVHLPLEEILKINLSEVSKRVSLNVSLSNDVIYKRCKQNANLNMKEEFYKYDVNLNPLSSNYSSLNSKGLISDM